MKNLNLRQQRSLQEIHQEEYGPTLPTYDEENPVRRTLTEAPDQFKLSNMKNLHLPVNQPVLDLRNLPVYRVHVKMKSEQTNQDIPIKIRSPSHLSSASNRSCSPRWDPDQMPHQNSISNNESPKLRVLHIQGKEWGFDFRDDITPSNQIVTTQETNANTQPQANTMILSVVSNYDKNGKEIHPSENGYKFSISKTGETPRDDNMDTKDGIDFSQRSPLPSNTKWKKLKSAFHSMVQFKREEVTKIKTMGAISREVDNFTLRQRKIAAPYSVQNPKEEATKDALDLMRRVKKLSECAAIGSPVHIQEMKKMIQADPKRYLRSPTDPDHLVNYVDGNGQTPMYLAAKNGNLEVVKLLVASDANVFMKSKVSQNRSLDETPLEVAVRWGHVAVIDYFLENFKWGTQVIKKCYGLAPNKAIKSKLKDYKRQNNIHFRTSIFACTKH